MPEKLTALIPCKDEETCIRACIESVLDVADEILVADSGSTDGTTGIAREYGCRIIEREYVNSADFKNWAIPQAANPWVLLVDADERVTPELAAEVRKTLAEGAEFDGYWIYRRNYFLGRLMRHCGWNRDKVLRLFKRDVCRYETKHVHAEIHIARGRAGRLKGRLVHHPYRSLGHYLRKLERYTTWGAMDAFESGRRAGLLTLTLRPAWRFFRHYVLQLGFLDGKAGLVLSALSSYSVFVKYAKLWELRRGREPDRQAGPEAPEAAVAEPRGRDAREKSLAKAAPGRGER